MNKKQGDRREIHYKDGHMKISRDIMIHKVVLFNQIVLSLHHILRNCLHCIQHPLTNFTFFLINFPKIFEFFPKCEVKCLPKRNHLFQRV